MRFIFDQMRQLQHVNKADSDMPVEGFAGAPIIQGLLSIVRYRSSGLEHDPVGDFEKIAH